MSREQVESILEQIRKLAPPERAALADEVDRVTWRDRVQALIGRVAGADTRTSPIADDEIDRIAAEVRSEKPLYERYWTRRRRSAP